jgi:hypothetical protein
MHNWGVKVCVEALCHAHFLKFLCEHRVLLTLGTICQAGPHGGNRIDGPHIAVALQSSVGLLVYLCYSLGLPGGLFG